MKWQLKLFKDLSNEELYAILQLRAKIFVVEQNCAYQDMDGTDIKSWHLFMEQDGKVIAYARLIPPGINYKEASIGRVVVDPASRNTGLGKELMKEAIKSVDELFGTNKICISAQLYLKKFYNNLGFSEIGDFYLEDDIPHLKMRY